MKKLLAYDLGTSGVKACLYDEDGHLLTSRYGKYDTFYPAEDFREQRPMDWWNACVEATHEMLSAEGAADIAAIGISGHSLGVIPVTKDGVLLSEFTPIWSDARAEKEMNEFFALTDYRKWYDLTGNGFTPQLYSIFKLMWIKKHQPEVYEKADAFIGTKDFINLKLTGKIATDVSYASGCGAWNLAKAEYMPEYLKIAGIAPEKMPKVFLSTDVIGTVTPEASKLTGIPEGVPVVAGGVDNACMALGAGCYRAGDGYASLGSSAWVTIATDSPEGNFEAKTYLFAHCVPGLYIPSVGIYASGSTLEWMIKNMLPVSGDHVYDDLSALVRESVPGANGLLFVPNLAGGSGFDPSPDCRGMFAGLDLKHTKADVCRAVFEGIALQLHEAYMEMEKTAALSGKLLLVGGGAKNADWRKIYAEIFNLPVVRTQVVQDAASLGAAALGAYGIGLWSDFSRISAVHANAEITPPDPENVIKYREVIAKYGRILQVSGEAARAMKE